MNQFPWQDYYRGNLTWLPQRTLLLTRHGSWAFGLNTPESDEDFKGIAIPTKEYFHGFLQRFEQAESKNPDLVIYDLRKFMALAADGNPSIIEVLWTEEEDWYEAPWGHLGQKLRDNRHLFLSRKIKHTFAGYAFSQLARIKRHYSWLLSPPTHKPTRAEFELPETTLISPDIRGAMEAMQQEKGEEGLEAAFPAHVMDLYRRERAYTNMLNEFHNYERWKATRNPKRAALEAKSGYDTKHAMHLVRLMRMCREILTTGQVLVKRPDREELLAIRNGAWSYDAVIEWAALQDEELTELQSTSALPQSPDRKKLDRLCEELVEEALRLTVFESPVLA